MTNMAKDNKCPSNPLICIENFSLQWLLSVASDNKATQTTSGFFSALAQIPKFADRWQQAQFPHALRPSLRGFLRTQGKHAYSTLMKHLRHRVPPGLLDGGRDEAGADVAFGELFLVQAGARVGELVAKGYF